MASLRLHDYQPGTFGLWRQRHLYCNRQALARVAIRIGDRETYFHKNLKGPVAIEKRKIKNVTEIVSVNLLSGAVAVLKNERRPLDDLVPSSEESED